MAIVVLDVNETLLDLTPIRSFMADRFGDPAIASTWFAELLCLAFVSTTIGEHRSFTELAGHALTTATGESAAKDDRDHIVECLRTLPPHPDVAPGLASIRSAGHRLAALTNSPEDTATAQLANAGLAGLLDVIMSVDGVDRFKPHPATYHMAADRLGVRPTDCVMLAAHDWDIAGAMAVGFRGIFVERTGATWSDAFAAPTHRTPDMEGAAQWLMANP